MKMSRRFPVVTLCGSTRFKEDFIRAQEALTLAGNVVLTLGFYEHAEGRTLDPDTEALLYDIHRQRMDMSDWIYVINRGGYIGPSTAGEIEYARSRGMRVEYMFPQPEGE